MSALKLTQIGNSVGVVLPKEALARLNASEGDVLFLTDGADGSFRPIIGYPPHRGVVAASRSYEKVRMRRDRHVPENEGEFGRTELACAARAVAIHAEADVGTHSDPPVVRQRAAIDRGVTGDQPAEPVRPLRPRRH